MHLNRRLFLGGATALSLAGCKDRGLLDSGFNFSIPGVDDIVVGESHLKWSGKGALVELLPESHTILGLDESGEEIWRYGQEDGSTSDLNFPSQVSYDDQGQIYVTEVGNHRVTVLDSDGAFVRHIGGPGVSNGEFEGVRDLAVHPDNGLLYTVDSRNHRVQVFDDQGAHQASFGSFELEAESSLNSPRAIAVSPRDGSVHVADGGNACVHVFDADGNWQSRYGSFADDDFFAPRSITVDPLGNSYVSDPVRRVVQIFDSRGELLLRLDGLKAQGVEIHPLELHFDQLRTLYVRAKLFYTEA